MTDSKDHARRHRTSPGQRSRQADLDSLVARYETGHASAFELGEAIKLHAMTQIPEAFARFKVARFLQEHQLSWLYGVGLSGSLQRGWVPGDLDVQVYMDYEQVQRDPEAREIRTQLQCHFDETPPLQAGALSIPWNVSFIDVMSLGRVGNEALLELGAHEPVSVLDNGYLEHMMVMREWHASFSVPSVIEELIDGKAACQLHGHDMTQLRETQRALYPAHLKEHWGGLKWLGMTLDLRRAYARQTGAQLPYPTDVQEAAGLLLDLRTRCRSAHLTEFSPASAPALGHDNMHQLVAKVVKAAQTIDTYVLRTIDRINEQGIRLPDNQGRRWKRDSTITDNYLAAVLSAAATGATRIQTSYDPLQSPDTQVLTSLMAHPNLAEVFDLLHPFLEHQLPEVVAMFHQPYTVSGLNRTVGYVAVQKLDELSRLMEGSSWFFHQDSPEHSANNYRARETTALHRSQLAWATLCSNIAIAQGLNGHTERGEAMVKDLLSRLGYDASYTAVVGSLVRHHHLPREVLLRYGDVTDEAATHAREHMGPGVAPQAMIVEGLELMTRAGWEPLNEYAPDALTQERQLDVFRAIMGRNPRSPRVERSVSAISRARNVPADDVRAVLSETGLDLLSRFTDPEVTALLGNLEHTPVVYASHTINPSKIHPAYTELVILDTDVTGRLRDIIFSCYLEAFNIHDAYIADWNGSAIDALNLSKHGSALEGAAVERFTNTYLAARERTTPAIEMLEAKKRALPSLQLLDVSISHNDERSTLSTTAEDLPGCALVQVQAIYNAGCTIDTASFQTGHERALNTFGISHHGRALSRQRGQALMRALREYTPNAEFFRM